ncbi:MAG: DNA glycosylase [bacterium]|nr:DNA glycosylase [bacterium]
MFTKDIPCLNLEQIALSGQCFRMNRCSSQEEAAYSIISGQRFLRISQSGSQIRFDCPTEDLPFWFHYFDLETNYPAIISGIHAEDTYLAAAARAGNGIRILNQDIWEMILTFILSQQKTIPKIREAVEALSLRYGSRFTAFDGSVCYAIPTPEQLSAVSVSELMELKLGYRAKYIAQIAKDALTQRLDLSLLASLPYEEALPYLLQFYGIGEKVANCICLFGLHHIDAFPVDTWIQKILLREYYRPAYETLPKAQLFKQIIEDSFASYVGYRGILQQYIFFYERCILSKDTK